MREIECTPMTHCNNAYGFVTKGDILVCLLCDILMRLHAFWLPNILFDEIECTRWLIGRCLVLCVQVGWFVGGESECKFCGGGWCKFECVGLQKGLCGSCLIRVSPHQVDTYV
jgi:hypothetical protein